MSCFPLVALYLHKFQMTRLPIYSEQEGIMPINKLYGGGIALMGKALDLRSEKQGLIQSNIANMETPGYRVQDFSFSKVMEGVMLDQEGLRRTSAKHLGVDPLEAGKSREFASEDRPVDMEEEMLKLSENQLMYEVTTRILAKKFEGLKFAIDEGGK